MCGNSMNTISTCENKLMPENSLLFVEAMEPRYSLRSHVTLV